MQGCGISPSGPGTPARCPAADSLLPQPSARRCRFVRLMNISGLGAAMRRFASFQYLTKFILNGCDAGLGRDTPLIKLFVHAGLVRAGGLCEFGFDIVVRLRCFSSTELRDCVNKLPCGFSDITRAELREEYTNCRFPAGRFVRKPGFGNSFRLNR